MIKVKMPGGCYARLDGVCEGYVGSGCIHCGRIIATEVCERCQWPKEPNRSANCGARANPRNGHIDVPYQEPYASRT